MSDALDLLCLAAGPGGSVTLHCSRVAVFRFQVMGNRQTLVDFESHEGRHDQGQAIRTLSGRVTPQREGRDG